MERVFDDGLDRCEARTTSDQNHRLVGVLAQVKRSQRPFQAEDLAPLVLRKQEVGEEPSRDMPDVEFEELVVVRRSRQRKAASLAVLEQEVDVLARQVLQPFGGRQLDAHDGDVGRRALDGFDAAGQPLDRDVARAAHFAHFDGEVGQRPGAAEERHAHPFLVLGQRGCLMRTVVDVARDDLALASPARAVAAAVGQQEVGAHRRARRRIPGSAGIDLILRTDAGDSLEVDADEELHSSLLR